MSKLLDRARRVGAGGDGRAEGHHWVRDCHCADRFRGGFVRVRLCSAIYGPLYQRQVQGDHSRWSVRGPGHPRGPRLGDIQEARQQTTPSTSCTSRVANAAGGEAVNLNPGETIIKYTDVSQSHVFTGSNITVTGLGNADTDKLVETSGDIRDQAHRPGLQAQPGPYNQRRLYPRGNTSPGRSSAHRAQGPRAPGILQRPGISAGGL